MRGYWFIIFPIVGFAIFGFMRCKKTEQGRRYWDRFKLRIPMKIGDTVRKITMARFSRTLSTLVAAGVDIIRALEITGQACGNYVVEQALIDVRIRVREGLVDRPAADREPRLPADGQPDGADRRGDR